MGLARALSSAKISFRRKSYKVDIDAIQEQDEVEKSVPQRSNSRGGESPKLPGLEPAWLVSKQNPVLEALGATVSKLTVVLATLWKLMMLPFVFVFGTLFTYLLPKHRRERIVYKFDSWITKRSYQTLFLLMMMGTWLLVGGFFYSSVNNKGGAGLVSEAMWQSWTFMADPGVHADAGSDCYDLASASERYSCLWIQRSLSLVIACGGIFFFSIVLGFVVDAIREKMDHLKKGKTRVLEYNHTLILGWTDKTVAIIKEIALANASENGGTVVLMGIEDKEYLDNELREQLKPSDVLVEGSLTRVVTRTGSPLYASDLNKVSAEHAKSIIILANDQVEADRSDAQTLRAVLTLNGLATGIRGHIVAEVRDVDNEALVRLVGGNMVETIVSHDIVGRLMLMSVRQPGLAKVYESILGFDGDEFYTETWDELVGASFGELGPRFPDAIPIGVRRTDGTLMMNPPSGHTMKEGEGIIVIAEDDDSYQPQDPPLKVVWGSPPVILAKDDNPPEKILFCGWRRDIRDILILLDSMVVQGSELHMISEVRMTERSALLRESGLDVSSLQNLTIVHHFGNTAVRRHLEKLPIGEYTSVMIMADELKETDLMHSDSHTLATLLLLRDIQKSRRKRRRSNATTNKYVLDFVERWMNVTSNCPCVCEILDARTQRTIRANSTISTVSDFVQSNTLMSRVLAMVSEDRSVRTIIDELLGADGCGFAVKSSSVYCEDDEDTSFMEISMRARKVGDIVIGYQKRNSIDNTIINPKDKFESKNWFGYDIVLLTGQSRLFKEDSVMSKVVNAFKSVIKKKSTTDSVQQLQLLNSGEGNQPPVQVNDDLTILENYIAKTDDNSNTYSSNDAQGLLIDAIRKEGESPKHSSSTRNIGTSALHESRSVSHLDATLSVNVSSPLNRRTVSTFTPVGMGPTSPFQQQHSRQRRSSTNSVLSTDLWELTNNDLAELVQEATKVIVDRAAEKEGM